LINGFATLVFTETLSKLDGGGYSNKLDVERLGLNIFDIP